MKNGHKDVKRVALMELKVCASGILLIKKMRKVEKKGNQQVKRAFSEFEAQTIQKYVISGKIRIGCHLFLNNLQSEREGGNKAFVSYREKKI